jgi:glycosyltransferase involved in cell wall biosynthesis
VPLITVIILTLDEELNLPTCLDSLRNLDAEIIVVDSGSSDRTHQIARSFGASVVEHPFENHSRQINWALDNVPISSPWVMRLDADERLTPDLARELRAALAAAPGDVAGFLVKRRVYFWGRWIRHGGYYPTWLLRVWRTGRGRAEDRRMDEHIAISDGRIARLAADIIDENRKGLAFWIDKHNGFSDREVEILMDPSSAANRGQIGAPATRKRLLKRSLYGRAPRFLRAFLYWLLRYIVLLGFLDGKAGFAFHFLQGFWYRLVVDAKLHELEHVPLNNTLAMDQEDVLQPIVDHACSGPISGGNRRRT